jgi:hypothetical protein
VEFSSSHRRQAESFLNDQKDSERPCILLWAGRDRLRKQHAYAKSICQHAHKSSHTPPTVLVPDMRISCWARAMQSDVKSGDSGTTARGTRFGMWLRRRRWRRRRHPPGTKKMGSKTGPSTLLCALLILPS